MKKIIKEHKGFKIGAFIGIFITVLLLLSAIFFTPNFVQNNLSPDGILDQHTIFKVNMIRINFSIFGTIGTLIIALYIFKPDLFYLMQTKISKIPVMIRLLFLVDLALCFTHLTVFLLVNHKLIITLFDLGGEANIPTWYSSIKLFCIAVLAGLFAYRKFDGLNSRSWILFLLPLLFLTLSMDESARIHERLGYLADFLILETPKPDTLYHKTGTWMFVIGGPFLIFFILLIFSIKKYFNTKNYAFKKILFGMLIFLSGALGVEIIYNFTPNKFEFIQNFCEEFLEFVGVTIIFWGFYHLIDAK